MELYTKQMVTVVLLSQVVVRLKGEDGGDAVDDCSCVGRFLTY